MTTVAVRPTASGGLGLFATQDFNVGDVILDEKSPLIVLSPRDEQAPSLLKMTPSKQKGKRKQGSPPSLYESIVPPSTIPSHQANNFRGMIQAAVSFVQQRPSQEIKRKILELYYPKDGGTSAEEQEIVHVADKALAYLQKNAVDQLKTLVTENPEDIKNIMLIWTCNSFEGGRLYEKHSRINHSCNPNAVVQTQGDGQCIRAATHIPSGDEITISYLGLFLYADGHARQQHLTKFFCACERCSTAPNVAAAIPCPTCHKRSGRYLDEDTQYDDEGTVHYAIPPTCASNSVECAHCHETVTLSNDKKPNHPLQLSRTVSAKVIAYMEKQRNQSDDAQMEEEWEEQLLQMASSVVGARHWATNLLFLMRLDRTLKTMSSAMITTGNPPDLTEVAELIDYLQRLVRFVEGLDLKLHIGHLIGNVIIGVARLLVALGDVKSKKYASEWLQKIHDDYVAHFESEDMKRVVQNLSVAWEKGDEPVMMDQEEDCPSNKRAKISYKS